MALFRFFSNFDHFEIQKEVVGQKKNAKKVYFCKLYMLRK
jgi:hypothetical protein